jgi:4-aminobutyrate aminotransferase-like enzyme
MELASNEGVPKLHASLHSSKVDRPPVSDLERSVYLLDRHLHKDFPVITRAKGIYQYTKDKRAILDGSAGAAVSCLGHGNQRVIEAVIRQMQTGLTYIATSFFASNIVEDLCRELIVGTGGKMSRVYLTGSGLYRTPNLLHQTITYTARI